METGIYDARYWRALAAEIRAGAEEMRDPVAKEMMLQIAADYDQLSEQCGLKPAKRTS